MVTIEEFNELKEMMKDKVNRAVMVDFVKQTWMDLYKKSVENDVEEVNRKVAKLRKDLDEKDDGTKELKEMIKNIKELEENITKMGAGSSGDGDKGVNEKVKKMEEEVDAALKLFSQQLIEKWNT